MIKYYLETIGLSGEKVHLVRSRHPEPVDAEKKTMSTVLPVSALTQVDYPDGDGKPVAETPIHRDNLLELVYMLQRWFAGNDQVYVSGNMFLYYVEGDKRKHVSPDVFVAKDVPRDKPRRSYRLWEEGGKGPQVVIEVTSPSTRKEDLDVKFRLYRDVLKVREYFLFDPYTEYLTPSLQGYRLRGGKYVPIKPIHGRLPSKVLGLHLERDGERLRLYDPVTKRWLPTPWEEADQAWAKAAQAQEKAVQEQEKAAQAQSAIAREASARRQAEAEVERLRRELETLRQRMSKP
jgi:Uma2 family endonuclease